MTTNNHKKELEKIFALDFGSPYFPLLANMYLEENDLRRAEKVCEIGLKHNPKNSDGQYVLSKVFIKNEQFIKAERLLKKVIIQNPIHLGAVRKLLTVFNIFIVSSSGSKISKLIVSFSKQLTPSAIIIK